MMVLAIWFDELIRMGEVKNFAELAELGQVCRTQISHVMNLLLLAPKIQEELLFLPRIERGSDRLSLKTLRQLPRQLDWNSQQKAWSEFFRSQR
jgi:hypothetical protein